MLPTELAHFLQLIIRRRLERPPKPQRVVDGELSAWVRTGLYEILRREVERHLVSHPRDTAHTHGTLGSQLGTAET